MWKRLLWPAIVNDADVDTVTRQGFWLCVALSVLTLLSGLVGGDKFAVLSSAAFMFAAAIGVRNHSIPAAVAVLAVYLGERLLLLRLGQNPIGMTPGIVTALLIANVRATWLAAQIAAKRTEPPPVPLASTIPEKFADVFPIRIWPYAQWMFWPLTALMAFGLVSLFAIGQ